MRKTWSPSAERNRIPIARALSPLLNKSDEVLELGSGTGQHVCYFSERFPDVRWQPTERPVQLADLRDRTSELDRWNLASPIALDINQQPWPVDSADVCLTINTLHIISWAAVKVVFGGASTVLPIGGKLCVYGPMIINGQHTSAGNQNFDRTLRAAEPLSGIRDLDKLEALALQNGFLPGQCTDMPANNAFVVWTRSESN
ncbi:MAG: DUF938 domain-containing protein [Granulosicoccus sp.]